MMTPHNQGHGYSVPLERFNLAHDTCNYDSGG
jgi:hypothetical protein